MEAQSLSLDIKLLNRGTFLLKGLEDANQLHLLTKEKLVSIACTKERKKSIMPPVSMALTKEKLISLMPQISIAWTKGKKKSLGHRPSLTAHLI